MWSCDVFKKGLHGSLILVSCILFVLYVYLVLFGLASAHYYELLGYWPAFLAIIIIYLYANDLFQNNKL